MTTTQIVLAILSVLIVGLVNLISDHLKLKKRRYFSEEYLSKFQQFVKSYRNNFDGKIFYWLTHRGVKMQSELGSLGIIDYTPPFASHIIQNYQLIPNTLQEMHSYTFPNTSLIASCERALISYIGLIDDWLVNSAKQLRNPLIWLREGVQFIVSLPILVLSWSGLIKPSFVDKITNNFLFKFVTGLIVFVGLIGSIITITLGWEQFVNLIGKLK